MVDVIPTTSQLFGETTISSVTLNSSGANNITVGLPGPSGVSTSFTVGLNYQITGLPICNCIYFIQIGIASAQPQNNACAYNGTPYPTASGSRTVTLTTPTVPGRYYIGFDRELDYQCNSVWTNGNPGFNRIVGVVDVVPTA